MLKNFNIKRIKFPFKYRFISKLRLSFFINLALASATLILIKPPKAVMAVEVSITYCWFLEETQRTTEPRQTCGFEYAHWAGGGAVALTWENGERTIINWQPHEKNSRTYKLCGEDSLVQNGDSTEACSPIHRFNPLTWEQLPRFYNGDTHYFYCVELPENLICWANPDDYGKDYLFAANKAEENDTFSNSTIRHRFDDVKSFGLAQLLENPDSLNEFKEMLDLVVQGEKESIILPNSSILDKQVALKPRSNCFPPFCFDEKNQKLTYREYLAFKIAAAKEMEKYEKMRRVNLIIESYKKQLEQDSMYGEGRLREIQSIQNETQKNIVKKLEQYKQDYFSFGNLINIWNEGFFQALNLALVGGVQFNWNLIPAGVRVYLLRQGINLSSIENQVIPPNLKNLEKTESIQQYFTTIGENLPKILQDCLNENNLMKCQEVVSEINAETLMLWDEIEDAAALGAFANATKSIESFQKIQDLLELQEELKRLKVIDKIDEDFFNQAIMGETWDFLSLAFQLAKDISAMYGASQQEWYAVLDNGHEIANSAKKALFDAKLTIDGTRIRNHYRDLDKHSEQMKIVNLELANYINKTAEIWGNYLIDAHSSAVKKQPDGTVVTTVDGFVRPLE